MLGEVRLALPVPISRRVPDPIRRLLHDRADFALPDAEAALRRLGERRVPRVALPLALALQVEGASDVMYAFPRLLIARREDHGVAAVDIGEEPSDLLLKRDEVHDTVWEVFCSAGSSQHGFAALLTAFVYG